MFYYKELPSLSRNGSNTLLLEAMEIGWELTGEKRYLEYGRKTFEITIASSSLSASGAKRAVEDTVIVGSGAPKVFAQSFIPLVTFYKALVQENMLD